MGYEPMAVKYHLLSVSYRRRLNFSFHGIEEAGKKLEKIHDTIEKLQRSNGTYDASGMARRAGKRFEHALDDNLDTGKALRILEEFIDEIGKIDPDRGSSCEILRTLRVINSVLGLFKEI